MLPFDRFLSHTLCCFQAPRQKEEEHQESPVQAVPYMIARKPVSCATINVPHGPEMADAYQFRRLFAQSPACPHENTPIGGTPERFKQHGSLDLDFMFHTGSPVPRPKKSTSLQKLSKHVKQKISESRLSKSSSKVEVNNNKIQNSEKQVLDPVSDEGAILLSISGKSTGLSDLLRSRSGSGNGYDSDAKVIQTPRLRSIVGSVQPSSGIASSSWEGTDIKPEDSLSCYQSSPVPNQVFPKATTELKAKCSSSPFPLTPRKMSFSEALRLNPDESPDTTLKRLSSGIANGTIRHPTASQLHEWKSPNSKLANETLPLPSQVPRRSSSLRQDPDTPQTMVKQLSQCINHERETVEMLNGDNSRSSILDQLDPALMEYLSKVSASCSGSASPQDIAYVSHAVNNKDNTPDSLDDHLNRSTVSHTVSLENCRSDVASSVSCITSNEQRSVHLFNMDISQRLASKSTATMLSPRGSVNASRKSFEIHDSVPPVPTVNATASVQKPSRIRAEHNRRPSDPRTKQLFENPSSLPASYQVKRNMSIGKSKHNFVDSNATNFCRISNIEPPDMSNASASLSTNAAVKNKNSIAIGGRSASSEIPVRSSSRVNSSISCNSRSRSLSTSGTQNISTLEAASTVINRYVDGSLDDRSLEVSLTEDNNALHGNKLLVNGLQSSGASQEIESAGVSPVQHLKIRARRQQLVSRKGAGCETPISISSSKIADGVEATAALDTKLNLWQDGDSVTEMWNRAFENAYKDQASTVVPSAPTVEMDHLRCHSSVTTVHLEQPCTVITPTLNYAIRRSHSEEVQPQAPPHDFDKHYQGSALSKTLKRFGKKGFHTPKLLVDPLQASQKLQKRSAPQLRRTSSLSEMRRKVSIANGIDQTPPPKNLLGIRGSYPSYGPNMRTRLAGKEDDIIVRDFGLTPDNDTVDTTTCVPLQDHGSYLNLRSVNSKPLLVSKQSRTLNRKAKSMTFPLRSFSRARQHGMTAFLSKWRRIYHTRSLEWRRYSFSTNRQCHKDTNQPVDYLGFLTSAGDTSNQNRRLDDSRSVSNVKVPSHSTPSVVLREHDRGIQNLLDGHESNLRELEQHSMAARRNTKSDLGVLKSSMGEDVAQSNQKTPPLSSETFPTDGSLGNFNEVSAVQKRPRLLKSSNELRIPRRFEVD